MYYKDILTMSTSLYKEIPSQVQSKYTVYAFHRTIGIDNQMYFVVFALQ